MGASSLDLYPRADVYFPEAVFRAGSATQTPFAVQGATGQTANLFEAKNDAGTILARIASHGGIVSEKYGLFGPGVAGALGAGTMGLAVIPGAANAQGIIVRGQPSQTASLQDWQNNSGTALVSVTATGNITDGSNFTLYNKTNTPAGNGQATFIPGSASSIGTVVRGAASQSANLQEWQNSAGSPLVTVGPTGLLNLGNRTGPQFYVYDGGSATTKSGLGTDMSGIGNELSIFVNGSNSGAVRFGSWNGSALTLSAAIGTSAAYSIFTVYGSSGQTGPLQDWQNNAGSVRAQITNNGRLDLLGASNASLLADFQGVLIGNAGTDPASNPANGGFIYVNGTSLMFRSSNGVSYKVAGP